MRYVLALVNLAFLAYAVYYYATAYRPTLGPTEAIFMITFTANALYLLLHGRGPSKGNRLTRMWGLWLDAKEKELQERATPKGTPEGTPYEGR
jgi:hypothetical protein